MGTDARKTIIRRDDGSRDDGEAGRALFAIRDLLKGEVLLTVPKRLIVLTSSIKNSVLGHKIEGLLFEHRLHCISEQLYLRVWLVNTWLQGPEGIYWTYLKSLPTPKELSGSPVAWAADDTAQRAALAGTSLLRRASNIRRKLLRDCETLQRELVFESKGGGKGAGEQIFDVDHSDAAEFEFKSMEQLYLWAWLVSASRAFGVGTSATSGERVCALVPFAGNLSVSHGTCARFHRLLEYTKPSSFFPIHLCPLGRSQTC